MMVAAHANKLKPGDVFDGRFVIRKPLGSGNFSQVYAAAQEVCGVRLRDVALKVFNEKVDADNAREVLADAITLCRLAEECPSLEVDRHLVHILDGGLARDHGGRAYLSMELIPGGELSKAIRKHGGLPGVVGVPVELSLHWLNQILIPLAWLHSLDPPAVHGDLHPGNVLITDGGEIKVVDFGLAARLPAVVSGGAIDYQAPETLLKEPGATQFDVYALGLIWYEMLTGHKPFRSDSLETLGMELHVLSGERRALEAAGDAHAKTQKETELLQKQEEYIHEHLKARKQPIPPVSQVNTQMADYLGLHDILNRCLRYDPNERYFNARHLKQSIDDYLAGGFKDYLRPISDPRAKEGRDRAKPPKPKVDLTLDQARRLAESGEFDRAQQEADKAVAQEPRSHRPWLVKTRIAIAAAAKLSGDASKRHITQAYEYANKAHRLANQNHEVLEVLAEVYDADQKPGMARNLRAMAAKLKSKAARRRL